MAKLKFGSVVTTASGKLGGHVIGLQNGVHVLKNKSVPGLQSSFRQLKAKEQTNFLMRQWSLLNDEQRRSWYVQIPFYRQINAFGDTFNYSGFALFQKINQGRLKSSQSLLLVPNNFDIPTYPSSLNVTASPVALNIQSDAYNSNDIIQVYASGILGNGISKPKRYMRFIANVSNVDLVSGVNLLSEYVSVFGSLSVNDKIAVGLKTVSSVSGYSNNILNVSNNSVIVQPQSTTTVNVITSQASDNSEEEVSTGIIDWLSSDLEFPYQSSDPLNQIVGMRFNGLNIPSNAVIVNAYVQFSTDEIETGSCEMNIYTQKGSNPLTFANVNGNISSRVKTTNFAVWQPPNWTIIGERGTAQQTSNFKDALQETINDAAYNSTDSICVFVYPVARPGKRVAESYSGSPTQAPEIFVEYYTT